MKALGVMVNTACCNTDFVDMLIKLLKFKILLKWGVFMLFFAVCTQTVVCLVKWLSV
jgi:hypothetical protein